MSSKIMGTKKKLSQRELFGSVDDDETIKAELEAMTNLMEYNLHGDYDDNVQNNDFGAEAAAAPPLTTTVTKKSRNANLKESMKNVDKYWTNDGHAAATSGGVQELQTLMRQEAITSEDKYKILEARDRCLRAAKRSKSQRRLSTTGATRGTCPDMCPEKERLMREFQRQVAPYELLDGADHRIDHSTAVKQYSRSSADQEEPMPWDLRPVESLKMTMSYLLHEIADLCESEGTNLGEWYHFLWDRTRGIRKDVTQQELCCRDSVRLVEQCARFHIICAERLCAEEPSVFDKKINTENLTKCLQTLKYMYNDLRLNGIDCDNEPEFRAYIILLNLNNGNFMWDVGRLPASVQTSPEIRFAIEVYSSLESNNYAKFFRLVRETSYANACILLRYFNQVRAKALSIMVKAYCRTTSTAFPLYELIDILGFEDENEAVFFCEQVGLNLSNDELHIMLDRRNFSQSVTNIEQGRAFNYIESKRISARRSIGLCIAGDRMPEKLYKGHRPHDSFDSRGYLKSESIDAEDRSNVDTLVEKRNDDPYEFQESPVVEKMAKTRETIVPHVFKMPAAATVADSPLVNATFGKKEESGAAAAAADKNTRDSIIFPNSFKRTDPIVSKKISDVAPISRKRDSATRIFGDETPARLLPNVFEKSEKKPFGSAKLGIFGKATAARVTFGNAIVSSEEPIFGKAVDRASSGRGEQRQQRRETMKTTTSRERERIDRETNETYAKLEMEIIEDICKSIVRESSTILRDDLSKKILRDILEDCIVENCEDILDREILIRRKLDQLSKRMRNRTILKYYGRWRKFAARRKRQRVALDQTPVWLQNMSVDECAKSLYREDQRLAIDNMRIKRLKISDDYEPPNNEPTLLTEIIHEGLRENARILEIPRSSPSIYWKMVVSWPSMENLPILSRYRRIVEKYICPSGSGGDSIVESYRPNSYETLDACVRITEGLVNDDDRVTIGTDALLLMATCSEDPEYIVQRLTSTISSRKRLMPIPVMILVLGGDSPHRGIKRQLDRLVDRGYVAEYTIRCEMVVDETVISKLIQNAAYWLAVNKSPPVPLEMDHADVIVDASLTEELWLGILGDSSFNEHLEKALRDVRFVIDLHNEAVARLTDILLDPRSLEYTDFSPELKIFISKDDVELPCGYEKFDSNWNNRENRARLEEIIKNLSLPAWRFDWPIEDTRQFEKCFVDYREESLVRVVSSMDESNVFDDPHRGFGKTSFVQLLLEILKEKIRRVDPRARVVYDKNRLGRFRNSPWWLKSRTLANYCERADFFSDATLLPATPPDIDEQSQNIEDKKNNDIGEINDRYAATIQPPPPINVVSFRRETKVSQFREISNRIDETLDQQKSRSRLLDEKLSLALGGQDSENNIIL